MRRLQRAAKNLRRAAAATWAAFTALRTDPAQRERAFAGAVFAGIFAFGAMSVDYLITGGPDWNPGGVAYAMEAPGAPFAQPHMHTRAVADNAEPPPILLTSISEDVVDYSYTSEELLGGFDWRDMQAEYAIEQTAEPLIQQISVRVPIVKTKL